MLATAATQARAPFSVVMTALPYEGWPVRAEVPRDDVPDTSVSGLPAAMPAAAWSIKTVLVDGCERTATNPPTNVAWQAVKSATGSELTVVSAVGAAPRAM